MDLLAQPFTGSLGQRLLKMLHSGKYQKLNIAVAFAKNSGVLRLSEEFELFLRNGGEINIYVGIDLGGTSYEALTTLLLRSTSLFVVHSETAQTFHSKIYNLVGDTEEVLIVGSNNLTGGGLWTNLESSLLVSSTDDPSYNRNLFMDYSNHLHSLGNSCRRITTQDDIDKLLQNGYIEKEVSTLIHRIANKASTKSTNRRLFEKGIPAKIPTTANRTKKSYASHEFTQKNAIVTLKQDSSGDTIWFETRAMTGGSRNILDLSMRSLIISGDPSNTSYSTDDEHNMKGAVQFFGLQPDKIDQRKNITINFNGVDYFNNTILFPEGANANGTWRLQIKGTDQSGTKITEALRVNGEPYLPYKIITFTRITDDHYFMSVFPEDSMVDFKSASWLLAYNGSSSQSRLLGIIRND